MVFLGIVIGFNATSIAQIWSWIMMALGAGVVVPNVLRWYWWRLNGWGYSVGTLGGMLLSLIALIYPGIPMYVFFPLVCAVSSMMSIAVSFLTTPVPDDRLVQFYLAVRPFGLWKPIKYLCDLPSVELTKKSESGRLALFNVLVGMCGITGLYLSPMFLVGHWYMKAFFWMVVLLISIIILKFTWYDNLPLAEKRNNNH